MTADRSPVVVVMGVSAAGKSSVGIALAAALGVPFSDADDLHPISNREKMARGVPLTDEERWPWLAAVAKRLAEASRTDGAVVACSALRRSYRDRLRAGVPSTVFVHLTGPPGLLAARAAARRDHFMPPELLRSQLDTLEPLQPDESGVVIDVSRPIPRIVESAQAWLGADPRPPSGNSQGC